MLCAKGSSRRRAPSADALAISGELAKDAVSSINA
jgi:hypothetical protein